VISKKKERKRIINECEIHEIFIFGLKKECATLMIRIYGVVSYK